ncbi:MAG: SIMPL domain-containing protein [Bacteroidetes bacterium]|nr:SIMPL domain-containing protein [Bacteroidota bacterium]MBI3481874.1 SIMPL domain-containing protein [Bacteroidota bacterium]
MKQLLTLIFVLLTISMFAQTGEKNFIDQNYIEVTGKAEIQITPDLIYLKIVLNERDSKNKISITELERKMTEMFQGIGIDVKKDLTVNDMLSSYKRKILAKSDILLYKEYQLAVNDAKTAGKVFSELEKIDISNVSIDRVDHSKIEEFRREIKINAIKAAKDKAEYLTKAVNQSIGRAILIQELNRYDLNLNANTSYRYAARAYDSIDKEIDIDFEKIKLEYSILVRFELK